MDILCLFLMIERGVIYVNRMLKLSENKMNKKEDKNDQ